MCSNHFALDERQGTILAREFVLTHILLQYVNHKDFLMLFYMFHNKNVNTYMFSFRFAS